VVLIATFFIFRSARQQPVVDQPAIAQKDVQPAPLPTAAATMVPAAIDPTLAAESSPLIETQPASTQPPSTQSKRNAVRTADVNAQPGGGSFDETLRQTRRPLPQGISIPNSPNAANPDEVMTHIDIPVREVLGQIGINADRSDGWRVKSVTPNSQAAHSGIQAGDVVLSLGDQDISARDNFESGGSVSSIKLRRGGKVITLPLKN
jgi:S1-C subfamily serine protease